MLNSARDKHIVGVVWVAINEYIIHHTPLERPKNESSCLQQDISVIRGKRYMASGVLSASVDWHARDTITRVQTSTDSTVPAISSADLG